MVRIKTDNNNVSMITIIITRAMEMKCKQENSGQDREEKNCYEPSVSLISHWSISLPECVRQQKSHLL